jgi:hypothetical protein
VSGGLSHTLTPSYTRLAAWGQLAPLSVLYIRAGVEPGLYFGTFGSLLSLDSYGSPFADDQRRLRKQEAGAGTGLRLFVAPSLRVRAGTFAASATVSLESWRSSAEGPYYYEPGRDTILRAAGDELVNVSAVLVRQLSRPGGGRLTYGLSYEMTHVPGAGNRSQRLGLVAVRRLASKHLGLPSPSLAARVGYYVSDPNRDGQLSLALGISVEREHWAAGSAARGRHERRAGGRRAVVAKCRVRSPKEIAPVKNLVTAAVLLCATTLLAAEATRYGKPLTVKETTTVSDILANPGQYDGKRVKVEGAVVDVCKMRGCWIKIAGDKDFESIQFKVDDGVITFPASARGKTALIEGVVSVTTQSVEEQKTHGEHLAKEQGKPFDPKSVTGPKTVIMLKGEGAEIR